MSAEMADVAPAESRYSDQRPYVVADKLTDLTGPTSGVVRLDRRLNWSGRAEYDLDNHRRLASMYETVLREASHVEQLVRWLHGPTLIRLWPELMLPPQASALWTERFPELAAVRRPAA
jgi:hypothetical protein